MRPWLVLAVVLVVGLLIGAAYLGGIGPFAAPSHPSPAVGDRPTFGQAEAAALVAARSYQSASWGVVLAEGIDPPSAGILSLNESTTRALGPYACNVTAIGSTAGQLDLPADPAEPDDGGATAWSFVVSAGIGVDLEVWVEGGTARAVATLSGGTCAWRLIDVDALAEGSLDSPKAVALALASGGAAFREKYPNATLVLFVEGAVTSSGSSAPAFWGVTWSACDPSSPSAGTLVPSFNVTLNAASGGTIGSSTNPSACPFPSATGDLEPLPSTPWNPVDPVSV